MWTEHCNSQVIPHFYKLLMEQTQTGQAAIRAQLCEGLAAAARMMAAVSAAGCFLGDDRFSLADVALAPWWQRMLTGV
jgi:glutathione S-transferase